MGPLLGLAVALSLVGAGFATEREAARVRAMDCDEIGGLVERHLLEGEPASRQVLAAWSRRCVCITPASPDPERLAD